MNIYLLIVLLICNVYCFAQNNNLNDSTYILKVEKNLLALNIFTPGASYERGISKVMTLVLDVSIKPSAIFNTNNTGKVNAQFAGSVNTTLQYRYYYNFDERKELGRNWTKNSANYLSFQVINSQPIFYTPRNGNENYKSNYRLSANWGLQRSYNNFYINTEVGAMYMFNANTNFSTIYRVDFKLGYFIFRK